MINRFPFYNYPNNFYNHFNYMNKANSMDKKNIQDEIKKEEKQEYKKSSTYNSLGPFHINFNGFSDNDKPVIEFAGLKLYLDDLLILSILFILYKEDVKDDMLFILLVLLLLT